MGSVLSIVHRALIIVITLVIIPMHYLNGQVHTIGANEYRYESGKWYNYSTGYRGDEIITKRIFVRFKDKRSIKESDLINLGLDRNSKKEHLVDGYHLITIDNMKDPFALAMTLSRNPQIESVEFDGVVELYSVPGDEYYASEQWNLGKLEMERAWDITTGSADVVVAVIDNGVDYQHPDLDLNIYFSSEEDLNGNGIPDWNWYTYGGDMNGIDEDGSGFPDDFIGMNFMQGSSLPPFISDYTDHGTAVAGIIK